MSTDNDIYTSMKKLPDSVNTENEPKPAAKPAQKSPAKTFTLDKEQGPTGQEPLSVEDLQAIRENLPEREHLLYDASEAMVDRENIYGAPLDNFDRIAALWEVVFGHNVTMAQVALCLDLVKTARLINTPDHRDSWVGKVGYSSIGGEVAAK